MRAKVSLIVYFMILAALLISCNVTQPAVTISASGMPSAHGASPLSDVKNGTWTCIDQNWDSKYEDQVDKLPIPDSFEGKSREELLNYAKSIGRALIWATDGRISPDGNYVTYLSNKDCIDDKQTGGMSVFLLNIKTGEEQILVKSEGGQTNTAYYWINDSLVMCQRYTSAQTSEYFICKLSGKTIPLNLAVGNPWIAAHNGNYFAYFDAVPKTSIRVAYIDEKDAVVEYKHYELSNGFLMGECAISPDHTKMALKVRQDYDTPTRNIAIWDFESGNLYEPQNPEIKGATDVSAIDFNWDEEYLQVNFLITTASDQHNELWQYKY